MKFLTTLPVLAALAAPVIARADTPRTDTKDTQDTKDTNRDKDRNKDTTMKLDPADQKLIAHLHHVNQMEIDLAKLAKKNGSEQVKTYADTILSDHQMADRELNTLAKDHKLTIGKDDTMDKTAEKSMDEKMSMLKKAKGAEFDRMYLSMMIDNHEQELANVKTKADTVQDKDLKQLVIGLQPVFQRHAEKARDLQAAMPKS